MYSSASTINHLLSVNRLTHNTKKKNFIHQKKAIKNRIKTFLSSSFRESIIILMAVLLSFAVFIFTILKTCVQAVSHLPYDLVSTIICRCSGIRIPKKNIFTKNSTTLIKTTEFIDFPLH